MGRICAHCGKKGMRGNFVSHSKQRTKRVFQPNLHSYKMAVNGNVKKIKLCTTCIRTAKKQKSKVKSQNSKVQFKIQKVITESHYKGEKPVEVKAVIPEEVKIEMKEKEEKKKKKRGQSDDLALIEEIMSQSLQKEPKKKK